VLRHDVARTKTRRREALIKADYDADPVDVKACVFVWPHPGRWSGN